MREAIFQVTYRPFVAQSVISTGTTLLFPLYIYYYHIFSPVLIFSCFAHSLGFFYSPLLSFFFFIYFCKTYFDLVDILLDATYSLQADEAAD
jgi:hypothetical protein